MSRGIPQVIGDRREQILALAQRPGVYNVRIFGSVARGEAAPDSDIESVPNHPDEVVPEQNDRSAYQSTVDINGKSYSYIVRAIVDADGMSNQ